MLVPLTPDDLQGPKDVACSQDLLRDTEMSSGETLVVTHFFPPVLFDEISSVKLP